MADEETKTLPEVLARHTIMRRNGDHFETIKPGTAFRPLDDDEAETLKANKSVFESPEELEMHTRAVQGIVGRKERGGITKAKVPHLALKAEAAHRADETIADKLNMPTGGNPNTTTGDDPAEAPPVGTDVGSVAARRASRRAPSTIV